MYYLFEHLLIVIGVLLVASAIILALQPRRTAQSSAAWVLFIIMLPYIAVPVFLVLGFRKSGRSFPAIRFSPHPAVTPIEQPPLAHVFHSLGGPEAVGGNLIRLHETPEIAASELTGVIDSARSRIDALLYVLAKDGSGERFLDQLIAKIGEGVTVRLSIDWLGSHSRPRKKLKEFIAAGGELRYFSPLDHLSDTAFLNLRNHRKMVIADCRRVWAGGRNVGDEYLASPPGKWVDLSFTAEGPILDAFNAVFASDWEAAGGDADAPIPTPAPPAGDTVLQLVPAGPDEPQDVFHDGLVTAIYRARSRIWIATPYFVPTDALFQALSIAARNGVDIRICLPRKSNQFTTDLARGPYIRALRRSGVRFHFFRPGMMHGKAGVIDDACWIGSANFDVRSMLLNFELAVMSWDPGLTNAISRWFERLMTESDETIPEPSRVRRIVEGVFRLGAPIL